MGVSTNGMLAYGYDLGGDETEWKVAQTNEYGELDADWYDDEDEDGEGFTEAAMTRLLSSVGFTEEYPHGQAQEIRDAHHDREREAKARVGVELETYAHGDYPSFLLATKVITVYRGDCETLDLAELLAMPEAEGWDTKLTAALEALGLTPTQDRAQWLLVSYADGF